MKRSLDPVWGQIFVFEVADPMKRGCGKACITVMDWDRLSKDDKIGWVEVSLAVQRVYLYRDQWQCDNNHVKSRHFLRKVQSVS